MEGKGLKAGLEEWWWEGGVGIARADRKALRPFHVESRVSSCIIALCDVFFYSHCSPFICHLLTSPLRNYT